MIDMYKITVRKPEVKRPLGSPWHRLEYDIKTDLRKTLIQFFWLRIKWRDLVNTGMSVGAPEKMGNFLNIGPNINFQRRNTLHGVYCYISYSSDIL